MLGIVLLNFGQQIGPLHDAIGLEAAEAGRRLAEASGIPRLTRLIVLTFYWVSPVGWRLAGSAGVYRAVDSLLPEALLLGGASLHVCWRRGFVFGIGFG